MKYYSTNGKVKGVSLKEAVLQGLAPDGGLYMPERIPVLGQDFYDKIHLMTFSEIAMKVAESFFSDDIHKNSLESIVQHSMIYDAPLIRLSDKLFSLELFHGPTLSFKDFGVAFMARLVAHLIKDDDQELNILAATSGDTGSAVGHGFLNAPGIKVWILYPKGQISHIQEQQLTTMGHNVTAFELEGSFDDCQALVKQAFNDKELTAQRRLSSANSINIARLIPQTFYYFYGYGRLNAAGHHAIFSVPSGNFGNLTAGLIAKKMGLPIFKLVAATNINDTVPDYLKTGVFAPQPSKHTISNAMDVGNPSNFARMLALYPEGVAAMRKDIEGYSFTDAQTEEGLRALYREYSYIADPHGAVGSLGLHEEQKMYPHTPGIFLETAHPAKFVDIIEPILNRSIDIPDRLESVLHKKKLAIPLKNDFAALKHALLKSV